MYHVDIVQSFSQVDADGWTKLARDVGQDYDWLRSIETSNPGRYDQRHMILSENGNPVAACVFYIQSQGMYATLDERVFGNYRNILNSLGLSLEPGLVSFCPLSACGGVLGNGGPARDSDEIVGTLARNAEALARSEGLRSTGFLYLTEEDRWLMRGLEKQGYERCLMGLHSVLDLQSWKSFDEYLGFIRERSRNWLNQVKSDLKKGERDGVAIRCEDELSDDTSRKMKAMLDNVYSKYHGGEKTNLRDGFFKDAKAVLKDKARVFIARKNGEPIGCSLFLAGREKWYGCIAGHSPEHTRKNGTYFNVFYHFPIMKAIEEGVRTIDFGMGAYQSKVRRGCALRPVFMFVKVHGAPLNVLYRRLVRFRHRRNISQHRALLGQIGIEYGNPAIPDLTPSP